MAHLSFLLEGENERKKTFDKFVIFALLNASEPLLCAKLVGVPPWLCVFARGRHSNNDLTFDVPASKYPF